MISNDFSLNGKYIEIDLKEMEYTTGRGADSSNSLVDVSVTTNKQVEGLQLTLNKNGFKQQRRIENE